MANSGSGTVSSIDTATGEVDETEPHSRRVHVANRGDGTVSAIGLPAG
ncbi:hypothetical protein [Streptomyces cyaneogriseus]|nr:hypothetical protein [Streptomyces cyaneogriseus]